MSSSHAAGARADAVPPPGRKRPATSFAAVSVLMLVVLATLAYLYVRLGDDHSDIGGYHQDALAFFMPDGSARHLPPEYPALSLVPFSVTLIPAGDFGVVFVV